MTGRLLLGLMAAVMVLSGAASARAEKIDIHLSWFANPGQAAVLVAADKGFYRETGLDVSWSPGKGSFDAVQVTGSGAAKFGIADAGAMLKGIVDGIPVMAVAVFAQNTPSVIVASPAIKKPKDLEGRKLATVSTTSTSVLLPAFAKATGIDLAKVEIVEASQSTQMPMFMSGKVDALDGQIIGEWIEVQRAGIPANLIKWSDYGLNMYGNAMLVNSDFAKANPEQVRMIVKATMKGMQYSLDHPDETVDIVKKNSAASRDVIAAQWKETIPLFVTDETKRFGLGWMTNEGWDNVQRLQMQYGGQKAAIPLERLYTTRFLQ